MEDRIGGGGGGGDWIKFPHMAGQCRAMMEDIATSINENLGALLCQSKTPSDVAYFKSPRGNAEGSFVLRSGTNPSLVKFVLGSWLHCKLGAGILNAATLIVMLGPENDSPHFMFEVIQNDSSHLIILLDLLPRRDLVSCPGYLKMFYEETGLEKCRQFLERTQQSLVYVPSSLYVRSALSPTALLFKFRDLHTPDALNALVDEAIHPTARKVFGTWLDSFRNIGRRDREEEGGLMLQRDEQLRSRGVEQDLSSNLPKLFGHEITDRVIAAIRKGE